MSLEAASQSCTHPLIIRAGTWDCQEPRGVVGGKHARGAIWLAHVMQEAYLLGSEGGLCEREEAGEMVASFSASQNLPPSLSH